MADEKGTTTPGVAAEKPAPDNGLKITGITFNKGNGQAAEKKEPEAAKAETPTKPEPAAEKKEQGDKTPKQGKTGQKPKEDKAKVVQPKKTREPRMPGETKTKGAAVIGGAGSTPQEKTAAIAKAAMEKADAPPPPPPPRDATRPGPEEKIVYLNIADIQPFKNHPFMVRDDADMKNLVESIKDGGVQQPALVRPREGGGYEMVAGHRRQHASELAGLKNIPCVVREMTDDEAILAMTESNLTYRTEILASERAQALKMQLDAIKRQGERFKGVASGDVSRRSNEIVAERNNMNYKKVQRYIALNNIVPELMKYVDEGKVKFIPAVELSYIKPKNQQYIAMSIEGEAPPPSADQAKRMRELDQKGALNGDVIDGIMLEEKRKGDIQVILNSQELGKYFGPEKTPAEMKATILKVMDEWKEKQPLALAKPEKKQDKSL